MRLAAVELGLKFSVDGEVYVHDLDGRSGSGKVAVKNVKTGEKKRLNASTEVSLASADKKVVESDIKREPKKFLAEKGLAVLDNRPERLEKIALPDFKEVKSEQENEE